MGFYHKNNVYFKNSTFNKYGSKNNNNKGFKKVCSKNLNNETKKPIKYQSD